MIQPFSNQTNYIQTLPLNSPDLDTAVNLLADAFMYGNSDPMNPEGQGLPDPFYNRLHTGSEQVHSLFRSFIHLVSEIGHTIAVAKDSQNRILGAIWIKPRGLGI